jgi:hypothetical protein
MNIFRLLFLVMIAVFIGCKQQTQNKWKFASKNVLFLKKGDPVILGSLSVGKVRSFDMHPGMVLFDVDWENGVNFIRPMKFQIVSSANFSVGSRVELIPLRTDSVEFSEYSESVFQGWNCDSLGCYFRDIHPAKIEVDSSMYIVEGELKESGNGSKIRLISRNKYGALMKRAKP